MKDGGISTGTGFLFALNWTPETHVPVIITNRHVINGAAKGRFVLTKRAADGAPDIGATHGFELDDFENAWTPHPDDEIDLCAMPLAPLFRMAEDRGITFYYAPFDKELIPTEDDIDNLIGLEDVIMIGYPNGIWDRANNLPIYRRGVLASDYKRDWNGRPEFLIDAACFPGSSGSPVLLFDLGQYHDKRGVNVGASRVKVLGVLYGGPQHTIEGEVKIVTIPTVQKVVAVADIPNNLGVCIKSHAILDFEGILK